MRGEPVGTSSRRVRPPLWPAGHACRRGRDARNSPVGRSGRPEWPDVVRKAANAVARATIPALHCGGPLGFAVQSLLIRKDGSSERDALPRDLGPPVMARGVMKVGSGRGSPLRPSRDGHRPEGHRVRSSLKVKSQFQCGGRVTRGLSIRRGGTHTGVRFPVAPLRFEQNRPVNPGDFRFPARHFCSDVPIPVPILPPTPGQNRPGLHPSVSGLG